MDNALIMIDASHIRTKAAKERIDPGIIEKDYILSKVLMALVRVDSFNESFLFKGGTALKKCFYPTWRFSEDIDLTATKSLKPADIKSTFQAAVSQVGQLFGVPMRVMEYSQYPKTGDEIVTAQLKLGYDGPLHKSSGQKNNVRVDIALDEVIVSEPIKRKIISDYMDDIEAELTLYPLEEIVAEKLRSILQRGKSRDYYDVWLLLKNHQADFSTEKTWSIMKEKCRHKGIPEPSIDAFFTPDRLAEASRYWERGLAHQVSELPAFEKVVGELRRLIIFLTEQTRKYPTTDE